MGGPQQESQCVLGGVEVADGAIQPVHQIETIVRAPDLSGDQKGAVMLHIAASLTCVSKVECPRVVHDLSSF